MALPDNVSGTNAKITAIGLTEFAQNKNPDTFKSSSPVTPTGAVSWCALQFLTATTCSEIKESGSATSALAIAYAAGTIIYGQFTSCTGDATGTVRAYYFMPII